MKDTNTIMGNNLTQGPILKTLLKFAFPMMAGNIMQQIYNIADTFIVGRFIGTEALAAVGSSYTLMVFLTSLIIGLCMGGGALFSTAYGAGNFDRMKKDLWMSFCFIGVVTVAIEAAVYLWTDPILRLLQIPESVYDECLLYVEWVFGGIVFIFLFNIYSYALSAMGNSRIPLVFLSVSSVLNIALDVYAVIVLDKGISGAAAATVLSQAVAGIGIMAYSLIKVPALRIGREHRGIDWTRMRQIIANNLFTGMQQSVMNFGILMIQGLVNTFGPVVMAAFTVAVKIDTLAYMPAQEFANAYSLFTSQNYGAGESKRIARGNKLAMLTSITFCLIISALVFLWAAPLMGLFVDSAEVEIIAEGVRYLRIEGATYVGIGILFLWYGYYRAIGRGEVSLLLTVVSLGTRVALSYALAPHTALGVVAIWASIPIGWALADITGLALYRKIKSRFV